MATRQPKGRPAITGPDKHGEYHCWLPTGEFYGNGRPKRKHIHRDTAAKVQQAIEDWEALRRQGGGVAGPIETVAQWLAYYAEHVVRPNRAYGTWRDVESFTRLYFTPTIGQYRLTGARRRLEPEHVEQMLSAIPGGDHYVRRAYRVLSRALTVAVRRGKADRNVCTMIDPPSARKARPKPLRQDHAGKVLAGALEDPAYLAARVTLGVIAGPRQGEVLGLRWPRVELDPPPGEVPHVWILRKLQRRTWEHGCGDPVACVKGRIRRPCRTKACPPRYEHGCGGGCGRKPAHHCPARLRVAGCSTHTSTRPGVVKACPPPCPARCAGHASTCPQRKGGGLVEDETKSAASDAPIAIGGAVAELLRRHRELQQAAYAAREAKWDPDGYVFVDDRGRPMDPRRDYELWKALLERVGVPHHKLHSGRHTAGTMLRAVGSDLRLIQDQLRHADLVTTGGYVSVALEAQQDAVDKVAAALLDGEVMALLAARRVAQKVA